ncbi:MAG TPA: hypothetical protein VIV61_17525 [Candidatus Ozemobacteraceae bacterium]
MKNKPSATDMIQSRKAILEAARQTLCAEFIGIDAAIDAVIRSLEPWYLFPELLTRPVVINLWGMTGVGKTSLVKRLVELIGFQNQFFWFDLGDKSSSLSFHDSYARLAGRAEDAPLIVAFDEVHHARCLDERGLEATEDRNRPMWELLDSGTVQSIVWSHRFFDPAALADKIEGLLAKGVRIRRGEFTTGIKLAEHELDRRFKQEKSRLFIPPELFDSLLEIGGKELGIRLKSDLEKHLRTLSDQQAVRFLRQLAACTVRSVTKRFSHLLVFIMGNLDEAFPMSNDFSADHDADMFYRQSLKVTIPQVKEALKKRFRKEQIARMGNTHILLPAIQKKHFEQIIRRELDEISRHVSERFNIGLEFGDSVRQLVYAEGVYPTQGYRPLFSTIHHLLKGNIGSFLAETFASPVPIGRILLAVEAKHLTATFEGRDGILFTRTREIQTPLSDLRRCRQDDQQAATAVHESGHGVVQMVLGLVIPNALHSVTSDSDYNGFMVCEGRDQPMTRRVVLNEAAILLGGFVAEKLVFGTTEITLGSTSDIARATDIVCRAWKRSGLGSKQMVIESWARSEELASHDPSVEAEIDEVIQEALSLAEASLRQEWRLFLALADTLSDRRILEAEEIRALCRAHSRTGLPDTTCAGPVDPGHRSRLKRLIEESGTVPAWPAGLKDRLREDPPSEPSLAAAG